MYMWEAHLPVSLEYKKLLGFTSLWITLNECTLFKAIKRFFMYSLISQMLISKKYS